MSAKAPIHLWNRHTEIPEERKKAFIMYKNRDANQGSEKNCSCIFKLCFFVVLAREGPSWDLNA